MDTPHLAAAISRCPALGVCGKVWGGAFCVLRDTFAAGGKVLVCGNGGSAADAEHIVGELMKGFLLPRRLPEEERAALRAATGEDIGAQLQSGLPVVALGAHTALLTAVANDNSAEMIFAQQVYALGRAGDTLVGISTSGNSLNVVRAFQVARHKGMRTVALTGGSGGRLPALADVAVCVPGGSVMAIQERHLPVYHALCAELEASFFGPAQNINE